MAASLSYAQFAQEQDAALRSGMDHVIGAGLADAVPILRVLAVVYIIVWFFMLGANEISLRGFVGKAIRIGVVTTLIAGSGFYIQHVRDFLFDGAPNEIATVIGGANTPITAAAQFDENSARIDSVVASIHENNRAWTLKGVADAIAAWFTGLALNTEIGLMFGVWMLGRKLLAIALCFGPWLLLFELFERTRGFVMAWVGTLVGLLVYQLGSSVLMKISLVSLGQLLAQSKSSEMAYRAAGLSYTDQAIGTLFHVVCYVLSDVFALLALPAICAIGVGAAAHEGAAALAIYGGARLAASGASGAAGAFRNPAPGSWGASLSTRGAGV
jgi:type IV secretion system protein VirB6